MRLEVGRIRSGAILDGIGMTRHEAERPLLSAIVTRRGANRPKKGDFGLIGKLGLLRVRDEFKIGCRSFGVFTTLVVDWPTLTREVEGMHQMAKPAVVVLRGSRCKTAITCGLPSTWVTIWKKP